MKKVVYVTRSLEIGGIEKKICSLCENIDTQQYEISVVCLKAGGPLRACIESQNIPVIVFHPMFFFFQFIWYLHTYKPDIVHSYNYTGNLWSGLALMFFPHIFFIAEITNITRWDLFRRILNVLVYVRADRIAVISKSVGKHALKNELINKKKLFLLYNSFDEQYFHRVNSTLRKEFNIDDSQFVFGVVARLDHPDKGHEILIKAVSCIKEKDFLIMCVGDGPDRDLLKKYAEKYGVNEKILWIGQRNDIANILSGIDCFILPSVNEGFGSTIIEAFACKTPVITSNAGGIPEVVTDESACMFSSRDHHQLSEHMKMVMNDLSFRTQLSKNGYERSKRFTIGKKLEKLDYLYNLN